jgi:hypothetical protein
MKLLEKSEWFAFESPIGEPKQYWNKNNIYSIERIVNKDGDIIWFGISINWKKEKGGVWTELSTNENSKPLEKYLPEIVYGEDRTYWKPCETPIYEQEYQKLYNRKNKLERCLKSET